ncbi:MAG: hypothetical protein HEQ38_17060 [Gemmatimonas sp.]|nr:hypothetical protein [Gemmatimonas sp.]
MKLLCLLLPFLFACGHADASTTDLPTLTVEMQADSARVIAAWKRPCDAKGCADSYRVQWTVRDAARLRNTAALADTLWVPRPAIGDTLVTTVAVTSVRRGIVGATRTATAVVRNPDAPPPAVDSLRTDTLTYEGALLDSFPVVAIRDTLGRSSGELPLFGTTPLCALARNRYTGAVTIMVLEPITDADEAREAERCERARLSYASERAG